MNKARSIALATIGIAIAGLLASLLLPTPSTWMHTWYDLHVTVGLSVLFTLNSLGAALLFVLGLKGFKTQLKIAYGAIAAGTVMAALCLAQLPVSAALDLWETFWLRTGLAAVPFLLGAGIQYFGIRLWAKQLQIKSLAANWGMVAIVVTMGIAVLAMLPHAHNALPERDLDLKLAIYGWIIFFNLMSVLLLMRMRRYAGKAYRQPQLWLMWGLVVNSLALAAGTWTELLGIDSTELWRPVNLADEFLVIASCMYLYVGYLFNRIGLYEEAPTTPAASNTDTAMLDVIFFLADLTSDPRQIDEYLDHMRQITATHEEGKPLSQSDVHTLIGVFNDIQAYLIAREPVRKFTQPGLQQLLQKHFSSETLAVFYNHHTTLSTGTPSPEIPS